LKKWRIVTDQLVKATEQEMVGIVTVMTVEDHPRHATMLVLPSH
jgi:hypothetical protein